MSAADDMPLLDSLRSIPFHKENLAFENYLKAFFKNKGLEVKQNVSTAKPHLKTKLLRCDSIKFVVEK